MPNRLLAAALVVLSVMFLSACQSLLNLEKPSVKLSSVGIEKMGLFEQQWKVDLRVTNPNEKGLTLKSLDYTLYVQDQKIATGMNQEPMVIPARSSEMVSTTISTDLFQTLSGLSKTSFGGAGVPYRVEGVAKLSGWPLPIHFNHKSELTLPKQ